MNWLRKNTIQASLYKIETLLSLLLVKRVRSAINIRPFPAVLAVTASLWWMFAFVVHNNGYFKRLTNVYNMRPANPLYPQIKMSQPLDKPLVLSWLIRGFRISLFRVTVDVRSLIVFLLTPKPRITKFSSELWTNCGKKCSKCWELTWNCYLLYYQTSKLVGTNKSSAIRCFSVLHS